MTGETLRYVGAAVLLIFSLFFIRSYKSYLVRRKRELEAFSRLIDRIYEMVDAFLAPLKQIFEGFSTGEEKVDEIIKEIEKGTAPDEAFNRVKDGLMMGKEGKEVLERLFFGLGKGYREVVLSLTESCKRKFSEYRSSAEESDEKSAKTVSALIIGCAAGIVLLLI